MQRATIPARLLLATVIGPQEIGKRIKRARERRGWTQLQLAMEANVSPSNVGSIVVINVFLGWTVIGWVVALAMAARTVPKREQSRG